MQASNIKTFPIIQNDYVQKLEIYRDLDRQIKALEAERDALKKEFARTIFAESDEFVLRGVVLATYKMQSRSDVDKKRLQAEQPDIYNFYQTTINFPVLRLK